MTEYGHHYANVGGVLIDSWGSGPFTITDETGKEWFFEDSDRFGPCIVSKRTHDPLDSQPGQRSKFWRAHRIWSRQGRRLDGDRCIWTEPKPTIYRTVTSRHRVVVVNGEEDGAFIEEPTQ